MVKKSIKIVPVLLLLLLCVAVMMLTGKKSEGDRKTSETSHLPGIKVFCPSLPHCGDSFLIYNDSGAVLIDTGEKDDSDILLEQLESTGITKLDALILTHYDKDHIGGAPAILEKYPVKKIYMACASKDSKPYKKLTKALKDCDAKKYYLTYPESFSVMGAEFNLYPPLLPEYKKDTDNNISIITEVLYKSSSLLFMGDGESERVTEFAHEQFKGIQYDFLKVAHHGRDLSITQKLLKKYFTPKFALVTSSEDEPENAELIEYMESKGVDVHLTRTGSVTYYINEFGIGKNEPLSEAPEKEASASTEATSTEQVAEETNPGVEAPVFSKESGFYDESFQLKIEAPKGTKIYYTTDSTKPTTASKQYDEAIIINDASSNPNVYSMNEDLVPYQKKPLYEGQAQIIPGYYRPYYTPDVVLDKCAVIRAIAVDADGNVSPVTTASYFIGFKDKTGYNDLSVMSLVSDPDGLFDPEKGIMVNGSQYREALAGPLATATYNGKIRDFLNSYTFRGSESEREVHIDYFDKDDRSLLFSQEAGMRLHGNMSRVSRPQKSFNLYARKRYDGNKTFGTDFFEDGLLSDTVTLMLGRDMRGYFISSRLLDRKMVAQNYRYTQVFLDGEYWGLYAIQDRYNSDTFLEQHYNVSKGSYSIATGKPTGFKVLSGDQTGFTSGLGQLKYFMSHTDLSDSDNYEKLLNMMDVQSFIDCYAARIYICDRDWNSGKNQYIFYQDGQWHWMAYDLDTSINSQLNTDSAFNSFTGPRLIAYKSLDTDPYFIYLIKNSSFCNQFVNTYMDLANYNYGAAYIAKDLDALQAKYIDAFKLTVNRYMEPDETYSGNAESGTNSYTRRNAIIKTFFEERFPYGTKYLAEFFGLTGSLKNVTIHTDLMEGGNIRLNTITPALNEEGSFTGQYYTDVPVSVTALPKKGYQFKGWQVAGGSIKDGSEADTTINVGFNEDVTITAIFEKE